MTQTDQRMLRVVRALVPLAIYLVGQLLTLVMVKWVGAHRDRSLTEILYSWDAQHFVDIARDGYTWSADKDVPNSPAFFPGLPALMRVLSDLTGWSEPVCGYLIVVPCGIAFAYGLMRLARNLTGGGEAVGWILVALISVGPLSIVFSMIYTEAPFCALAVWGLVCLLERRWLAAGLLAVAAGLIRPTGGALIAAVGITALVAFVRGERSWQVVVGALIAPLGLIGYIAYVGWRIGRPGAWFEAQTNGWNTTFDLGVATAKFIGRSLLEAPAVLDLAVTVTIAASLVLLVLLVRQQRSLPLATYTIVALLLNVGSDGIMNSKIRLMIPAFSLLIPIAVWLARQRPMVRALTLVPVVLAGTWYSAYGLVIYGYAI